jgi:hypothetical protein
METNIIIIICCIFLVLLWLYERKTSEKFTAPARVELYSSYNYKDLYFTSNGPRRLIIKGPLKSYSVTAGATPVELWSVDSRDISTASSESGFYNTYTEPDIELRANPSRYILLARVAAGNTSRGEITIPVKKVYIISL